MYRLNVRCKSDLNMSGVFRILRHPCDPWQHSDIGLNSSYSEPKHNRHEYIRDRKLNFHPCIWSNNRSRSAWSCADVQRGVSSKRATLCIVFIRWATVSRHVAVVWWLVCCMLRINMVCVSIADYSVLIQATGIVVIVKLTSVKIAVTIFEMLLVRELPSMTFRIPVNC